MNSFRPLQRIYSISVQESLGQWCTCRFAGTTFFNLSILTSRKSCNMFFLLRNRNGLMICFSIAFYIFFQPPDSNILQGFVERIPGVTTLVKDPVSGDLRARSGNQVWCVGCPYTKGWVPLPETNIIPGNTLGPKRKFIFQTIIFRGYVSVREGISGTKLDNFRNVCSRSKKDYAKQLLIVASKQTLGRW